MIQTMLNIIQEELHKTGIPYEYMQWTGDKTDLYFVGEYAEVETLNEDGAREYNFSVTGTTNGKWLEMENCRETIESHFPTAGGLRFATEKGAVAIFYDNSIPVNTGNADLKRIEIHLSVKAWKGMI